MDTPCILWTGATNDKGYGQRRVGGRLFYVHRLAWEEEHGPIPPGMTIDHICLVKLCLNTLHMEVVTRAENTRRAKAALTVCRKGHSLADAYICNDGTRRCRPCKQATNAAWKARAA